MKKVILTEAQLKAILMEEVAGRVAGEVTPEPDEKGKVDPKELYKRLARLLTLGRIAPAMLPILAATALKNNPNGEAEKQTILQRLQSLILGNTQNTDMEDKQQENPDGTWKNKLGNWKTVSNDTIATVYNAVPAQCNKDVVHTASMFKLNLSDVLSQRVIAMERTYRAKLGLKYGDIVYIEGTGKWDGPWQIQDTMNKRFAGLPKIDILVPNNITTGMWHNVKLSIPTDEQTKMNAKSLMRGSA